MLQIDVIDNEEELSQIAEEWSDLLSKSHNNAIFLTFEWLSTWWKYFKNNKELRVLTARDEDRKIIGIAPLVFYEYKFLPILSLKIGEFIGSVHSDYLDFIILKGKEDNVLDAFFVYLIENNNEWDVLNFIDLPEESTTLQYIKSSKKLTGLRFRNWVKSICPYITLPEKWDDYLSSLSKKRRKKLQYYLRRLKKEYFFQFGIASEKDNVCEKTNKFFSLHQSRWREKGALGDFADYKFAQFHKDIISKFIKKDWLKLYYLSLNGNIVSMLYAFNYNQKICYYQSGFEPEYSKYSLGTVTIGCCIENAIAEGTKEFNFLRGDESYKYDWGANQARRNIHCQIFNQSLKARLYYHSTITGIWLKSIIKVILPRAVLNVVIKFYRGVRRFAALSSRKKK